MSSLLSAISGQFTKSLILGTFLPVVLFTSVFLWLVHPSIPAGIPVPGLLEKLDSQWQVFLITLLVITLSGILYNLNTGVIRLYEGYPWLDTWFGRLGKSLNEKHWRKTADHRKRIRKLKAELNALSPPADAATAKSLKDKTDSIGVKQTELAQVLNESYPYSAGPILPTRLGNTIRNFEEYAKQRYGTSSIPVWPRLIAKIDSSYGAQIDDAKLALDFMLNCSFLGVVAGLASLWFGIATVPTLTWAGSVGFLWKTALFWIVAWLFYQAAIGRASAWGAHVKSSFDLFRLPLLKQLGYQQEPKTLDEERQIWKSLALEYSYPDNPKTPLPYRETPPAPAPLVSVSAPGSATTLEWARGVSSPPQTGYPNVTVTFRITNSGAGVATKIVVTDTVPANWHFVWGSAALDSNNVAVVSTSPLTFEFDNLAAGATRTLSYRIQGLVR